MKTILLMRHAKSNWDEKIKDDQKRPISKRGEKNTRQISEILRCEKLIPDLILTSSAVRAKQTADLVMDVLKYKGDFCSLKKLYMAEMEVYVQEIQRLPEEVQTVLIIGHNPCLEGVLQILSGKVEPLSTSTIAHLTIPIDAWKDFSLAIKGELVHLWRPKDL